MKTQDIITQALDAAAAEGSQGTLARRGQKNLTEDRLRSFVRQMEEWIKDQAMHHGTCTYNLFQEKCDGCECQRFNKEEEPKVAAKKKSKII